MPTTDTARPAAIAVAQTCPVRGDVDANVDEHLQLADAAADVGADLIVFPELSLTGYELDMAAESAFTTNDPRLDRLAAAASELGVTMVVGAPVRVDTSLHIGAFVVRPDRQIDLYTKRRLGAFPPGVLGYEAVPPPEATIFVPGNLDPLVRIRGITAALAICADIGDSAHPACAAARGADAYLASMFIIPPDYEADAARLAGYARRHAMLVAAANFGSASGGLPAAGGSAVWSADGTLLLRLDDRGPGVGAVVETERGWTPLERRPQ